MQSETLKRQKAAKKGFFHDALAFLRKPFEKPKKLDTKGKLIHAYAQDHSVDETAEFILNLLAKDSEIWRTSEEGKHFKLETSTGEIKAGFGGKFNGKKIGEEWEPGKAKKPSVKGGKVAAPVRTEPAKPKAARSNLTFNVTPNGIKVGKELAEQSQAKYDESVKEAESVFGGSGATLEQKGESLDYLISTASGSDQWRKAQWGDTPSVNGFGLGKVPREWVDRLTPDEQETLDKISEKTDEMNYIERESWIKKNEAAYNTQLELQAKLLGANIDVEIPDDVLKEYAGKERREELPGQQSMFYGENVPVNSPEPPVAKEQGILYNVGEVSKYFTGEHDAGHNFPEMSGGTVFASAKPETFRDAVVAAQDSYSDEDGWRVGPHDEYSSEDKCFASPAGSTTCVAPNGDIVSVCKKAGSSDRAGDLLEQAIANGGTKLDAYGMGLFRLYTSHGFEPCSWCEWNDEYAPEKWKRANGLPTDENDTSWHGRLDSELAIPREPILFYRYTGNKAKYDSPEALRAAYDGFLKKTKSTGTDYDAAYAQRDGMMGDEEMIAYEDFKNEVVKTYRTKYGCGMKMSAEDVAKEFEMTIGKHGYAEFERVEK